MKVVPNKLFESETGAERCRSLRTLSPQQSPAASVAVLPDRPPAGLLLAVDEAPARVPGRGFEQVYADLISDDYPDRFVGGLIPVHQINEAEIEVSLVGSQVLGLRQTLPVLRRDVVMDVLD